MKCQNLLGWLHPEVWKRSPQKDHICSQFPGYCSAILPISFRERLDFEAANCHDSDRLIGYACHLEAVPRCDVQLSRELTTGFPKMAPNGFEKLVSFEVGLLIYAGFWSVDLSFRSKRFMIIRGDNYTDEITWTGKGTPATWRPSLLIRTLWWSHHAPIDFWMISVGGHKCHVQIFPFIRKLYLGLEPPGRGIVERRGRHYASQKTFEMVHPAKRCYYCCQKEHSSYHWSLMM